MENWKDSTDLYFVEKKLEKEKTIHYLCKMDLVQKDSFF